MSGDNEADRLTLAAVLARHQSRRGARHGAGVAAEQDRSGAARSRRRVNRANVAVDTTTPAAGRLIDRFMPQAEITERHETLVQAPAAIVFDVARNLNLQSVRLVRVLFWLRAKMLGAAKPPQDLFSQGLVAQTTAMGWGVLAHRPGRELVMGSTAQPWKADVTFKTIPSKRFTAFGEPDLVKIVWTLEADPLGPALTRFRTETRVRDRRRGAEEVPPLLAPVRYGHRPDPLGVAPGAAS